MEQGDLRKIIIAVIVLFAVYIIMKIRTDRIRRRHDERSRFRHDR